MYFQIYIDCFIASTLFHLAANFDSTIFSLFLSFLSFCSSSSFTVAIFFRVFSVARLATMDRCRHVCVRQPNGNRLIQFFSHFLFQLNFQYFLRFEFRVHHKQLRHEPTTNESSPPVSAHAAPRRSSVVSFSLKMRALASSLMWWIIFFLPAIKLYTKCIAAQVRMSAILGAPRTQTNAGNVRGIRNELSP